MTRYSNPVLSPVNKILALLEGFSPRTQVKILEIATDVVTLGDGKDPIRYEFQGEGLINSSNESFGEYVPHEQHSR